MLAGSRRDHPCATCGMMPPVGQGNATTVRLRPLTARSAILSLLLGVHPPSATVSELVAFGRYVAINDSAVRAAVTYVAGMTDRYAFDMAVRHISWPVERLPRI